MSKYIVIPKDILAGWDMLSDGELGSIVRTLIRYETTETTKVFTEKHMRMCYCTLVAVQRMHEQELEERERRLTEWEEELTERRSRAARAGWEKRHANAVHAMHANACNEFNACNAMHQNASEEANPPSPQPAPAAEPEELRLESPDENAEKSSVKKGENKEKNQKKIKSKEIAHTPNNNSLTVTVDNQKSIDQLGDKENQEGKESQEGKEKKPGAQGIARGKKLAAKDIAMLYPEEKAAWQEWSKIYPAHRRAPAGPEIMEFVRLKGLVARKDEIFQTILNFQQQDADWKNGYIPRMTKFFKEERYENSPTPERVVREKKEVVTHYVRQFKPEEEETTYNPNLFANDKPKEQHG